MERYAHPHDFRLAIPDDYREIWDTFASSLHIILDYRFPAMGYEYARKNDGLFYMESKSLLKLEGAYRMKIMKDGRFCVAFRCKITPFLDGGDCALWSPDI